MLQSPRGLCAIHTRSAKSSSHLCQDLRHDGGHELAFRSAALSTYHLLDLSKHPRYKLTGHVDNRHARRFARSRLRAGKLKREKAKPMQEILQMKSFAVYTLSTLI